MKASRTHATVQERVGLSPTDSAQTVGCSPGKIYEAIADGELIARKLGRRTIILRDDLMLWLNSLPAKSERSEAHRIIVGKRWHKQNGATAAQE
ncbi:MAG: helix-turn-helix domain-containing protein [Candidatus Angelobacter sp.]